MSRFSRDPPPHGNGGSGTDLSNTGSYGNNDNQFSSSAGSGLLRGGQYSRYSSGNSSNTFHHSPQFPVPSPETENARNPPRPHLPVHNNFDDDVHLFPAADSSRSRSRSDVGRFHDRHGGHHGGGLYPVVSEDPLLFDNQPMSNQRDSSIAQASSYQSNDYRRDVVYPAPQQPDQAIYSETRGPRSLEPLDSTRIYDYNTPPKSLKPKKFRTVEVLKDCLLGVGSYGSVYKVRCDDVHTCAAKVIHPILDNRGKGSALQRFIYECECLSCLRHPNIVQYLGTHMNDEGHIILLIELMDESLTHFLEHLPAIPPFHTQVNICHDVAMALSFLHSKQIIHRDLSSNNILMIGDRRAKVTDFGMAKLLTMAGKYTTCPGTRNYMPPEALLHDSIYNTSIDCFSLGVISLQVLTGKFPTPTKYLEAQPGGLQRPVPEVQRRRGHIKNVNERHPILAITLTALRDNSTERPSSLELSTRFEALKKTDEYIQSTRMGSNRRSTEDSAALRAELANKSDRVSELESLLTGKDTRIRDLESSSVDNDTRIRDLESLSVDNDTRIRELESLLTAKETAMREKQSQCEEIGTRSQKIMSGREKQHEGIMAKLRSALELEKATLSSELSNCIHERDIMMKKLAEKDSLLGETLSAKDSEIFGLRLQIREYQELGTNEAMRKELQQLKDTVREKGSLLEISERERRKNLSQIERLRQSNLPSPDYSVSPEESLQLTSSLPSRPFWKKSWSTSSQGQNPQVAVIRQPSLLSLNLLGDGKPCALEDVSTVSAILRSEADNSISDAPITSTFEVQFTPLNRGRHVLAVLVDGIETSSHKIFVHQPPERIKNTLKIIRAFKGTFRLAINNGLIYSSDPANGKYHIVSLDNYTLLQSVPCNRKVCGIAVDNLGNVYVSADHIIQKYDSNGSLLKYVGSDKPGDGNTQFRTPSSVRLHQGCIYVCDKGNGRIMVFDLELNHLAHFGRGLAKYRSPGHPPPGHLMRPEDIAFGDNDRTYVLDCGKEAIVVFKKYLYECLIVSNDPLLSNSQSICMTNDSFFVTNWPCHQMLIYNSSGNKINSVEINGDPLGLCTDEDGFIYVSNMAEHSILVY